MLAAVRRVSAVPRTMVEEKKNTTNTPSASSYWYVDPKESSLLSHRPVVTPVGSPSTVSASFTILYILPPMVNSTLAPAKSRSDGGGGASLCTLGTTSTWDTNVPTTSHFLAISAFTTTRTSSRFARIRTTPTLASTLSDFSARTTSAASVSLPSTSTRTPPALRSTYALTSPASVDTRVIRTFASVVVSLTHCTLALFFPSISPPLQHIFFSAGF